MHPAIGFTFLAMAAFAANSLLARAALGGHGIDAAGFTAIRLVSGAAALAGLLALQRRRALVARPGSWSSAGCLFVYALAFSLAYLRLSAATGALILFGAVQATLILWGVVKRDRPAGLELAGLVIAFAAFLYLLLPGLDMPDPRGSVTMLAAGIAWGFYTLRGRGGVDPLAETCGNFVRAGVLCVPLAVFAWPGAHATGSGAALAVASGAITSGLGYALWYHVLPRLSTIQSGCVQLTVPVLAAIGAVVFLREAPSWHLALSSLLILGGVAVAILSRRSRARTRAPTRAL